MQDRIMKRLILVIFIFSAMLPAQKRDYIWPTNAPRLLSGSFGEPRAAHFHSAIDIKTWAQIGYECYAIDNGYIQRLRVHPFGYGKVLYLKMDDGNTAVYAHLDGFSPRLENVVTEVQYRNRSTIVDTTFPPGAIRVRKGNLIAYTGGSGTVYPHLHFEIRDSTGAPVNPLTNGLSIKDPDAPVILKLGFTPLNEQTAVMGLHRTAVFEAIPGAKNIYTLRDTIQAWGKIGLELLSYDRAVSTNKNAAYRFEVYHQGKKLFQSLYERFRFENNYLFNFEKNHQLNVEYAQRFQSLYFTDISEQLGFFDPALNGQIDVLPGYQTIVVQVRDVAGNRASLRAVLYGGPYPQYDFPASQQDTILSISLDSLFWKQNPQVIEAEYFNPYGYHLAKKELKPDSGKSHLKFDGRALEGNILSLRFQDANGFWSYPAVHYFNASAVSRLPEVSLAVRHYPDYLILDIQSSEALHSELLLSRKTGAWQKHPFHQISLKQIISHPISLNDFANIEALTLFQMEKVRWSKKWEIKPLILEHGMRGELLSSDSMFAVIYPELAYYHPRIAVWMEELDILPKPDGGELLSKLYKINPNDQPVRESFNIAMRYPLTLPNLEQVQLYRYNADKGKYSPAGGAPAKGKDYFRTSGGSGTYALVRDLEAPSIEKFYPADGGTYDAKDLKRIWADLDDNLSGFGSGAGLAVYVNDQWTPHYYNGPTKRIEAVNIKWRPGRQIVKWVITDTAGHQSEKSILFYVRK
jgi:hypothetical protein